MTGIVPGPPLPDRELAPIYALFGAALHDVQVLEYGLLLVMALATQYEHAQFSFPEPGEALSPARAGRTLGELFRAVKDTAGLDAVQRRLLRRAIRRRNELIHGFMVERAERFLSPSGREELRGELERARELLAHANAIVAPLVDRYLAEHGTSLEALKSQAVVGFDAGDAGDDGDEDEPGV